MATDCFGVSQRAAQRYVQFAERRLSRDAIRHNPLFWLQISPQQRNLLLQMIFGRMKQPEGLSVKDLMEMMGTANKIMDSRDRTAAELLRLSPSHGNGSTTVQVHMEEIEEAEETQELAAEEAIPVTGQPAITSQKDDAPIPGQAPVRPALPIPSPTTYSTPTVHAAATATASADSLDDLPDDFELSPEIMARLYVKVREGHSLEDAIDRVIEEVEARNPKLNQEMLAEYERQKAHHGTGGDEADRKLLSLKGLRSQIASMST